MKHATFIFFILMLSACSGSKGSSSSQNLSNDKKNQINAILNPTPAKVTPTHQLVSKDFSLHNTLTPVWEGTVSSMENLFISLKKINEYEPVFATTSGNSGACIFTRPISCPTSTIFNLYNLGCMYPYAVCTNQALENAIKSQYGFERTVANSAINIPFTLKNFKEWKTIPIKEPVTLADIKLKVLLDNKELTITERQVDIELNHAFKLNFKNSISGNLKIFFDKPASLPNTVIGHVAPILHSCVKNYEGRNYTLSTINTPAADGNGTCTFGQDTFIKFSENFSKTNWTSTEKWSLNAQFSVQAQSAKALVP